MAATADAFAVNPTHPQLQPSSSRWQRSSSSRTYHNNNGSNIIIRYNSLRDLLGTPNDKNHEILSNRNKPKDDDDDTEKEIDTSNADNFNNMLHPQRRNFQGRPSSDSGRLSQDDDELGLNNDRLQPFSFSGQRVKENNRVKKQGGGNKSSSSSNKPVVINTEAPLPSIDNNNSGGEQVRANDFNNMIGIAYSKKSTTSFSSNRNPITQQNSSKDVDLETGMHRDKISTFSFSSKNSGSAFLEGGVVSGSNGGSSLREETWAGAASNVNTKLSSSVVVVSGGDDSGEEGTIGGESKEERQKRMKEEVLASAAATTEKPTPTDPAMSVDNFHNMINVDMSKNTGLKRLLSPRTDGQVNHADRMETFSLLSTEDENDGSSGNLAPETLEVNHSSAMGTFSFASGAKKKPKLQQMADAASASAGVVQKDESTSKPASSTAAGNTSNPPPSKDTNKDTTATESFDTRSQVYSLPQRGSLSSLASSLKTHSRADRIKEIQIRTDPKLLHPDGMNVPRLNAKGDVMSMSSTTGGKNVFERIEADLANQVEEEEEEIVAEKQEEDSSSDEIVADDEEEEEEDDKEEEGDKEEDTVGEK